MLTLCLSCVVICSTAALSEDLTTLLDDQTTKLTAAITELDPLVTKEVNSDRKKSLKTGQDALKVLQTNAERLQKELTKINDELKETSKEDIDDKIKDLKTWEEEQLKRVNAKTGGPGNKTAKELTQTIINRYNYSLPKSLEEQTILTTQFEKDCTATINIYIKYATTLITQMKGCKDVTASRCRENIVTSSEKVLTSSNQLTRLIKSSKQLLESGSYTKNVLKVC